MLRPQYVWHCKTDKNVEATISLDDHYTYAQRIADGFPSNNERPLFIDEQYTKIEYGLVNGKNLTDLEKILFSIIHFYSGRPEGCTMTNIAFGERLEKKETSVSNAISRLLKTNMITRELRKTKDGTERHLFSIYRLKPETPVWLSEDRKNPFKQSIYRDRLVISPQSFGRSKVSKNNSSRKVAFLNLLDAFGNFFREIFRIKKIKTKPISKIKNFEQEKQEADITFPEESSSSHPNSTTPHPDTATQQKVDSKHSTGDGPEIKVQTINTDKKENKRAGAKFSESILSLYRERIKSEIENSNSKSKYTLLEDTKEKESKILEKWSEEDDSLSVDTVGTLTKKLIFIKEAEKFSELPYWQCMAFSIGSLYSYRNSILSTFEGLEKIQEIKNRKNKFERSEEKNTETKPVIKYAPDWSNCCQYINSLPIPSGTKEHLINLKVEVDLMAKVVTINDPVEESKHHFIVNFYSNNVEERFEVKITSFRKHEHPKRSDSAKVDTELLQSDIGLQKEPEKRIEFRNVSYEDFLEYSERRLMASDLKYLKEAKFKYEALTIVFESGIPERLVKHIKHYFEDLSEFPHTIVYNNLIHEIEKEAA